MRSDLSSSLQSVCSGRAGSQPETWHSCVLGGAAAVAECGPCCVYSLLYPSLWHVQKSTSPEAEEETQVNRVHPKDNS